MRSLSRNFIGGVIILDCLIILFILFHIGGIAWEFSQLAGAIVGGAITLLAVNVPVRDDETVEPWLGRERIAWILIGCGCLMWGFGESFWRYFILKGLSPFPSQADIGYSALPPLIFLGMLLQPSSGSGRARLLLLLDSVISMGALLAIAWYLLLGSLALQSVENPLAKFLGLYYPTTDIALLSCVVFLLLRGQSRIYQSRSRRIGFIVVGIGLCFFATSDFIFNVQQNMNAYVEGTWVDIGWPLGMATIGLAAYLRRFLPSTDEDAIEQRLRRRTERGTLGLEKLIPYILLSILFIVLVINVLSTDTLQVAIRPVLLFATIAVVGLVVLRQIMTLQENERLTRRQADALRRLEQASQHIEEQSRMIAERNASLELGVTHLKDVQARLANGNLRVRARLIGGELMPLAASLNLMAERLMRLEQSDVYAQRLSRALSDLSVAIEHYRMGGPFIVPTSCNDFAEINHLLLVMGFKQITDSGRSNSAPISLPKVAQHVMDPVTGPAASNAFQQQTNRQPVTQQAQDSPFQPFSPDGVLPDSQHRDIHNKRE
ncbi:MAG TPA: hypothetical protein VNG51_07620 [Ktedonobacteraceae bacterium]|nr:hypothetical protein [Ktedonobacteraceae bacterium]